MRKPLCLIACVALLAASAACTRPVNPEVQAAARAGLKHFATGDQSRNNVLDTFELSQLIGFKIAAEDKDALQILLREMEAGRIGHVHEMTYTTYPMSQQSANTGDSEITPVEVPVNRAITRDELERLLQ